jgi:hypothetical protein
MSEQERHGFAGSVRRFFRLPRGTPREPAQALPLLHVWLVTLVIGAVAAAVHWADGHVVLGALLFAALVDEMAKGVRHRWPALAAALFVVWAAAWLAHALVPGAADSVWREYAVYALSTLPGLAAFVSVTRLPGRRSV